MNLHLLGLLSSIFSYRVTPGVRRISSSSLFVERSVMIWWFHQVDVWMEFVFRYLCRLQNVSLSGSKLKYTVINDNALKPPLKISELSGHFTSLTLVMCRGSFTVTDNHNAHHRLHVRTRGDGKKIHFFI